MNLYELSEQRLALQNKLQDMNFDEETIADTLEAESGDLQEKIESYAFVIRNMEALAEAMKLEESRMADRRKAKEKQVVKIREWLMENMRTCKIEKLEFAAFTVALKTNPPKVIVDDEKALPNVFFVLPDPLPPQLDKKALAVALKAGDVAGAHLEKGVRLEIK